MQKVKIVILSINFTPIQQTFRLQKDHNTLNRDNLKGEMVTYKMSLNQQIIEIRGVASID